MKKRLLITLVLCIVMTALLAISVGAECQTHDNKWTTELGADGYLGPISATAKCKTCGAVTKETIPALFITRGYSYSESGGIAQGYGVDRDAIARYEEITGEKVQFGGVLAVRSKIGDYNPLDINLNPLDSSVKKQDFTDSEYSVINIMVQGIPVSNFNDTRIICALYVSAGGRITYIDNRSEKINCGDKTFNEVVAKPEADISALPKHSIIDGKRYHEYSTSELVLTQGKFWNSTSLQVGANQAFDNKFWTTGISFNKETLPVGSIIFIDSANGWQYRPHKMGSTRPKNTKTEYTIVDEAWWTGYNSVGFNISKYDDGTDPTENTGVLLDISGYTKEEIAKIFKILIPYEIYGNPATPDVPDTPVEPDEPILPDEPLTDYSDQKQNWDDDGVLKILTIGNSFSDDSMQYVYQVAQSAGIENVVLGNLFIGGCSLDTHLNNAQNSRTAYTYRTNTADTNGEWTSVNSKSINGVVASEDWDFISFQQVSGYSGVSDSYAALYELIRIVEPLNPSARLVWHMTWAYQKGSGHADFPKYNCDQMTMYNSIVNAVKTNILTNDHIDIVIPAGTSIQNVRTSYIGDTLTRDGYHLSFDYGRLIGSISFVKALTGVSIDNITYMPEGVDANELAVAIEAVNNAYAKPFEVTNSIYTTKPSDQGGSGDSGDNEGGNQGGNEGGTQGGITGEGSTVTPPAVPNGYTWLSPDQMGYVENSYYQSDANSDWYTIRSEDNDFSKGFITTKKFTREELPVGSIIVIADGWQYRPEGWINGAKNSSSARPSNMTTHRIVITESWWGNWTERAFNISKVGNTTSSPSPITEQEKIDFVNSTFFIYVPNESYVPEDTTVYIDSSDCDEEIVTIEGKQYRALKASKMGYIQRAYYFSTGISGTVIYSQTDGTSADFWATKVFSKTDLPIGAVLWVNSGWRYRPEGWINGKGGTRPNNVTTTYVTMDETWWGNWTERAFNLSKTNGADIGTDTSLTADSIHANFKIYIPVENIKEVTE